MSDRKLAQIAEQYADIKAEIKRLEEQADKRKRAIIKELDRRKVKAIEIEDGPKITKTRGSHVDYDLDQLKKAIGPKRYKLIVSDQLDKDKLAAAVQDGKVPLEKVESCSKVVYHAAYPIVSKR